MFGIATVSSLSRERQARRRALQHSALSQIGAEPELAKFGALSKLNTEQPFLQHLHDLSRRGGQLDRENFMTAGTARSTSRQVRLSRRPDATGAAAAP
jgi:hypothetical protein